MKDAMRAKDMARLTTIRFTLSEIKNYEIDNGPQNDEGVQKVIAGQVKKMTDAINDYQAAGRDDLVTDETAKVDVLKAYLPAQLSDADLDQIVADTIVAMGKDNMGAVIGAVMKKVGAQADGGRVSAAVRAHV